MDERILKPIQEATYLTVTNAWRYRFILRYCYQQHERLRHYLSLEEIYAYLQTSEYFQEYNEEMLQRDLEQLVEWENLIARQETGRVRTIEEFKKRKYRYQLSPYTIEIERMVIELENLGDGFGGSLERSLFDRLLAALGELTAFENGEYQVFRKTKEEIHLLWQDLYEDFRKLTENATDYLAHLQSEKVEEKMRTEAFLVYKEAVTEYLRIFMTSLQRSAYRIEGILKNTPLTFGRDLVSALAEYELSIPRLDSNLNKEYFAERFHNEWEGLKIWFIGDETRESDLIYLQNATNDAIRRLTRFAQRLSENHHNIRSRRTDYLHLAQLFCKSSSLQEAHKLSACVFGVFHSRHLLAFKPKQTESFEVEVWDEPPAKVVLRPRVRTYQEKTKASAVHERTKEKQKVLGDYFQEKEAEKQLIEGLVKNGALVMRDLPLINIKVRKMLLSWITKCMLSSQQQSKTETGQVVRLKTVSTERIRLHSEDGVLEMPDYILYFDQIAEAAK